MLWLDPITAPVAFVVGAHAWIIPELYAARGATVARPKGPRHERAESVAQGLLGDLLGHRRARAPACDGSRARARGAGCLAGRRGRRTAGHARRAPRARVLRGRPPRPSCLPRIASLTCCWRCAWTRRASPRLPTTPSPARPGGYAAACPPRCAPRSTRASVQRDPFWRRRASLDGCAIRRRDRRRGLRRVVRGAPAGAPPAPPQRPHPAGQRRELPALHAAAAGRRGGIARAAPRGGAAARGAGVGGPPARPRDRRRPGSQRDPRDDRRRPRRDAPLRPADRHVGSVSRVLPVPGLAEHGLGFKTLADAIAMRNRALLNLEIAESLPDDESRSEYLTFVFVGRRLRRPGGHRRAAGLRGGRDRRATRAAA